MIIAPSVLSLDYSRFNEQLSIINQHCEWLHFDVMDGHFVPNLSFGPDIFKTFRKNSDLFMDVHLMVSDPDFFSDIFIKAGADSVTFHYEAYQDISTCLLLIEKLKKQFVKIGISVKPGTAIETIEPLLKEVDMVLVMSVEPGFGGQKFMESALDKITYLRRYRELSGAKYTIEVDGGINSQNAHLLKEAGTDIIVAGSYLFKGDMIANIENISFYD